MRIGRNVSVLSRSSGMKSRARINCVRAFGGIVDTSVESDHFRATQPRHYYDRVMSRGDVKGSRYSATIIFRKYNVASQDAEEEREGIAR